MTAVLRFGGVVTPDGKCRQAARANALHKHTLLRLRMANNDKVIRPGKGGGVRINPQPIAGQ